MLAEVLAGAQPRRHLAPGGRSLSRWRKEARDGVPRGRVSVPKAVKAPPARDMKRLCFIANRTYK